MKNVCLKGIVTAMAVVLFASTSACAAQKDQSFDSVLKQTYVFRTYLKEDAIQARAVNGFVTLSGTVAEESHKALAQETAGSLPGVKGVVNQLEVTNARLAERSDGWIQMQAKYLLLYNRHVNGPKTQVSVTDGIVTLRGEAESQAQKDLTGEYVKGVEGVKEVKNELVIVKAADVPQQARSEKIDDASITSQVKLALWSHSSTRAFKAGVATSNGVVTLSGQATSSMGKDLAAKVANDVLGVTQVVNNMTVDNSLSKN